MICSQFLFFFPNVPEMCHQYNNGINFNMRKSESEAGIDLCPQCSANISGGRLAIHLFLSTLAPTSHVCSEEVTKSYMAVCHQYGD